MAKDYKKQKLLNQLRNNPVHFARMLGFKKLGPLHNRWIIDMIYGKGDKTLQAHRGSYKTTCVAVALALIMILYPNDKTMFNRKTDTDVKEIIAQVKKILENDHTGYMVNILYSADIELVTDRANELSTNLGLNDPRGTSQLLGMGIKGSVTGKHYDRIFTDDIVNKEDRASRAEREKTKSFYQELQNIKNRDGRIYNTGTPWHKDDCFSIMPEAEKHDCYHTGLISDEILEFLRSRMTASLFSANYELRHIASDKVLFLNPQLHGDPANLEQGESHIDASYGGEDGSAFTIVNKKNGKYYVLGKLRQLHIDVCQHEFVDLHKLYKCKVLSCEDNGDKGYLAKDLRAMKFGKVLQYHEDMNKYIKISSYLKAVWPDVIFCEGTDEDYLEQILDYNIEAEHDDAPDSLASLIRKLWGKKSLPEDMVLEFM